MKIYIPLPYVRRYGRAVVLRKQYADCVVLNGWVTKNMQSLQAGTECKTAYDLLGR